VHIKAVLYGIIITKGIYLISVWVPDESIWMNI